MTVRDSQGRVTEKFRKPGFSVLKDQNQQSAVGQSRKVANVAETQNSQRLANRTARGCEHCNSNLVPLVNLLAEPIYPYVSEHYGTYHHLPVVDATIGGWTGKVLLDTGATRSIISQEIVNRIGVLP